MNYYGNTVNNLIEHLARLPSIGGKSAQRLAFHIMRMPKEEAQSLADSIVNATSVKLCSVCCNLTDEDICPICADDHRQKDKIMVVETPRNMAAYEKIGSYKGQYHILHGAIAISKGIGPEELKIRELVNRIDDSVSEVIVATNPTVEGDVTASYISRLLKPLGVKVTRIANGVPVGSDLEYVDDVTLTKALEGRSEM